MYRHLLLVLLALGFSVAVCAAGEPEGAKSRPVTNSYEVVKTTRQFIIGGIGVAGTTSGEEADFRQLLQEPGPAARCQALLTDATPAGQLYGLLGLRLLDPPAFQKALPRYLDSQVTIQTMSGCISFKTTAARVAKEIEEGRFK